MDLQKLIESQAKLATEAQFKPDERTAGADAVNRPVELQQAQADRVRNRIASLEKSKAALIESIDAELNELKGEHEQRTRRIKTERKNLEAAAKAVAAAAATKTKKSATKDTAAATDSEEKKTRASSAKGAKPA
ncbi:MAG TPA: hypothetical protein VEX35_12240 [Allosphingosinicella sp.]|nr:hypothetical protein [Allosphingosinicella sp.]